MAFMNVLLRIHTVQAEKRRKDKLDAVFHAGKITTTASRTVHKQKARTGGDSVRACTSGTFDRYVVMLLFVNDCKVCVFYLVAICSGGCTSLIGRLLRLRGRSILIHLGRRLTP